MTESALPAHLQKAMNEVTWSLQELPTMYYKSVPDMKEIRQPALPVEPTIHQLEMQAPNKTPNAPFLARIAASLFLLGMECTDEAHDLVLGLSWRGDLPYAYGPDVSVKDEGIQSLACYTHCLIHRKEGPHQSEFDMTGFQNSNYWAGMTMRNLDGIDALPLTKTRQRILYQVGDSVEARKFVEDKITEEFDPRVITELCSEVVAAQPAHHPLVEFAQNAARAELQVLLEHVLTLLGFAV